MKRTNLEAQIPQRAQVPRRGQGTIEYLVIIAVVVVVALVVVGLLISLSSPGAQVSQVAGKLNAAAQPVSVLSALAGADGNGVLTIKNNTGDGITITKITIGDSNQDISAYFAQGDSRSIQLNKLPSCTPGTTKTYSIKINYTSSTGLAKTQTIDAISVNCETTAIATNPTNILLDTGAPTITLTSPIPAYNTPLTQIDFNFIVTDQNTIRDCNLIIDSVAAGVNVSAPTRGINITLTKSGLSTGDHTWDVNCTDATGNRGTSGQARNFHITPAPTITLTSPQAGYATALTQIDFNFKVHGEIAIRDCNLIVDGATASVNVSNPITQDINITLQKTGLTIGAHTWDVNCTDTNNNRGTSGIARTFYIQAAPVVYLSTPLIGLNTTQLGLDFNFWVSDLDGGVRDCNFILDGLVSGTGKSSPTKDTNLTFSSFSLSGGAHTWDVNCSDMNGNRSSSGSPRNFTINQPYYFLKNIPSLGDAYTSNSVYIDPYGNTYMTFQAYKSFWIDSTRYDINGNNEAVITKWNSDGNLIQLIKTNGSGDEASTKLLVDSNGNMYFSGTYTGQGVFGNFVRDANSSIDGSKTDIFVAKIDSNGNWLWVNNTNSGVMDYGGDIVMDPAGNIYMVGYFGQATMGGGGGPICFRSICLDSNTTMQAEIFVAKLGPDGNWLWVQRARGTGNDSSSSLALAPDGNLYITGSSDGNNTMFGSISLPLTKGANDIFVAKISPDGNWLWAKSTGGTGADLGRKIFVDSNGLIYAAGTFSNSVIFDVNRTSAGYVDVFVGGVSPVDGNWLWSKAVPGVGSDMTTRLTGDNNGNLYLSGNYSGVITFDTTTLPYAVTFPTTDGFIAKLNSDHNWTSAKGFGATTGTSTTTGQGIGVDSLNGVYATGWVCSGSGTSTAWFDSTRFDNNNTYTCSGYLWKTSLS